MKVYIPTYQPSSFLLDNQAKILPIPPKIAKSLLFVLTVYTCDALCLYILNGHSFFKQKYSKSSKFDTFLKQLRFICRLVGMGRTEGEIEVLPRLATPVFLLALCTLFLLSAGYYRPGRGTQCPSYFTSSVSTMDYGWRTSVSVYIIIIPPDAPL